MGLYPVLSTRRDKERQMMASITVEEIEAIAILAARVKKLRKAENPTARRYATRDVAYAAEELIDTMVEAGKRGSKR